MIVTSVPLEQIEISSSELATLFNVSDRWIRELAKTEVIPQRKHGRFNLHDAVRAYVTFLRKGSPSNGHAKSTEVDYNTEKALLTKAQREKAELEVSVLRGELHRGEDVRAVMGAMIMACKSRITAIPSKIAPQLLAQTEIPVIQDMLRREIDETLTELADYNAHSFNRRNKKVIPLEVDA